MSYICIIHTSAVDDSLICEIFQCFTEYICDDFYILERHRLTSSDGKSWLIGYHNWSLSWPVLEHGELLSYDSFKRIFLPKWTNAEKGGCRTMFHCFYFSLNYFICFASESL